MSKIKAILTNLHASTENITIRRNRREDQQWRILMRF